MFWADQRFAAPRAEDTLVLDRKKTRALLAVLAVDPKRMVPRARLTTLLWAGQNEDVARHGLRQCLLDLRHALASGKVEAIRAEADLIGLEPSRVVVDVEQFERLAGQGTADALNEAVGLYQGDLLEGFNLEEQAFEEWLRVERERLRSRAVAVLSRLLADHVREKVLDAAIHIAARLLTFEPYDEAAHRSLMRFYAESGPGVAHYGNTRSAPPRDGAVFDHADEPPYEHRRLSTTAPKAKFRI